MSLDFQLLGFSWVQKIAVEALHVTSVDRTQNLNLAT